ncbi:DUF551 domain-containing protein [Salmonella enterica]|uniref:DUF551 domain-containing protein n=1 Tax=Salmonella enterica TaxID=28901 RepID=UPI0012806F27|nr:DUF551 domain-containing protein [Salmonella enterica]ECD4177425.1 DUF551 domain-containing protein [Salmonella enterica subsp. enterica serovar Napoli]EDV0857756.1 DUF551 domain-containing protein [Salmonella enterica subsp. enterica]
MNSITKERIELFIKNPLDNGLTRGEQMEVARIALASLEAEPIAWECGENIILFNPDTVEAYAKRAEISPKPLYAAPPAPAGNEFIPKNLDKALGVVGVALPESKEEFNFQIERWIQRLIDRVIRYADEFKEQPAPVVPEEAYSDDCPDLYASQPEAWAAGWNACRAALLQGAEPVSQTYELPQTQFGQIADLYEMQFDDGRTCAFHTDDAKAAQWLLACDGNKVQEYVRIERYQEAVIGNPPVTQDGWISCSERMPDSKTGVLVACEFDRKGDWRMKWGTYIPGHPDARYGWVIPGASWKPSHWMPLPEPPQEVNRG